MELPIVLTTLDTGESMPAKALLDSGCSQTSIDYSFVQQHRLTTTPAAVVVPVHNADGSLNSKGSIRSFASLRVTIGDHQELMDMAVVHLDSADIFLGHDWLKRHNLTIDWSTGALMFDRCPESCGHLT